MNAGEMVQAVYENSGYRQDDRLVTPEVVLRGINRGLRTIAGERDWPWLQASAALVLVVGDPTYPLSTVTDYVRTRRIVDNQGTPLDRYDAAQLEVEFGLDQGTPCGFAIDNEELVLRPIPTQALTFAHFYVRREKKLTADTETPYLPIEWHDAAVVLGEAHAHRAGRNQERADDAQQQYEQVWRPRMLDDVRRTRGPLRQRIRPGSAF